MTQTKFPEELHLTFKTQHYWDGKKMVATELPLAFSHIYEPTKKGWDKKCKTQMDWAYGPGRTQEADGVWFAKSYKWEDGKSVEVQPRRVPEALQPKVIKNEPMSGFKISHSVSRYSTSNKLWRIEDPRGFELEISTANMEEILMQGAVVKGEIQGTLCWWTAKMLKYVD